MFADSYSNDNNVFVNLTFPVLNDVQCVRYWFNKCLFINSVSKRIYNGECTDHV